MAGNAPARLHQGGRLKVKIVDLGSLGHSSLHQAAAILVAAFKRDYPKAWPALDDGIEQVHKSLEPGRIARGAVDESGRLLGWIGGIEGYEGHAWELHPLSVHPDYQGQGIGSMLVRDFEQQVIQHGAHTVYLGSDDETGQTSLTGVDLYPDVLSNAAKIRDVNRHPFVFYQKLGYVIVGVIPDANGFGKPDILMAKRLKVEE